MADEFGFEAGGEFAPAFEAAQRRLRGSQARQRSGLARATSRVRTSGARFIPAEAQERGFAEADAGLVGRFALAQAEGNITDRRAAESRSFQREQLGRGFSLEEALQRRIARGRLPGQIGAGALGAIGGIFAGRGA